MLFARPTSLQPSPRLRGLTARRSGAAAAELARFAGSNSPRSRRACASSQPAGASSRAAGWPDGRPPGPHEAPLSARATTAPSRRRLHLQARGTSRRTASKSLWMPPSFTRLGRGISARRAECGPGGRFIRPPNPRCALRPVPCGRTHPAVHFARFLAGASFRARKAGKCTSKSPPNARFGVHFPHFPAGSRALRLFPCTSSRRCKDSGEVHATVQESRGSAWPGWRI